MAEDKIQRALGLIAKCNDPKQLRQIAANAASQGEDEVRHAAELRLYDVLPAAKPDTLEFDVWRSIYALEGSLKAERGKTTLLSRTRQKIGRDGEQKTVADLVLGKESDGFRMLLERGMAELTFEAVALRHKEEFDENIIAAAEARLVGAGCEPSTLRAGAGHG